MKNKDNKKQKELNKIKDMVKVLQLQIHRFIKLLEAKTYDKPKLGRPKKRRVV